MSFQNTKKRDFLNHLPVSSLDNNDINQRCKFNFSYFDSSQDAGRNFKDWPAIQLEKLLNKLKDYSCSPLLYWQNARCGAGGLKILEVYGGFPKKSDFKHPQHVPYDVSWARFRLENMVRLVGFVIPKDIAERCKEHKTLDCNTFYVVFLDREHKFYKTENA